MMTTHSSRLPTLLLACSCALALLAAEPAQQTADLMEVLPVTDRIVAFHFREGHVTYPQVKPDGSYVKGRIGRPYFDAPLAQEAVEAEESYRISSSDDPAYAEPLQPLRVGFKAKGLGFMGPGQNPQHLRAFTVYAELPHPLQPGRQYRFDAQRLSGNDGIHEFAFDVTRLRSPTIQVNQVGFTPDAPKFAFLSQWMGNFASPDHAQGALDLSPYHDAAWQIRDVTDGSVALRGQGLRLQKSRTEADGHPKLGNWTGADVYEIDFSELRKPGRYVLAVDGIGSSHPFRVGTDAYRHVYQAASRGIFFQRMGIEKDVPEFATRMPRGQHPDDVAFRFNPTFNSYSHPREKSDPTGFDQPVEGIWGWYADAGDWDHYASGHYLVPMTMLLLYNLKPENFADGDVGNRYRVDTTGAWIEEAGNGLPDLLDEARWLIDFGRRTRHALIDQNLGTGGVPGYVGIEGSHGGPSWDDQRMQAVGNEMPTGTYAYAACAAYLAYSLDHWARLQGGSRHPESAAWITEAREAFAWAEASDRPRNGKFDELNRVLAVAALYAVTGEQEWEEQLRQAWNKGDIWANHPGPGSTWRGPNGWMLAAGLYLQAAPGHAEHDAEFHRTVAAEYVARTDRMTDSYATRGYRFGGIDPLQQWTRGMIGQPRTLMQAVAHHVTGDRKYLDEIHAALAYMLGGNQDGRSRLTGVGHRHDNGIFHIDSWYLLSFNHPAYADPILPGYSPPGLRDPGFDIPAHSSASEDWSRTSALPAFAAWPFGEQRMYNRWSVAASEFTIQENLIWWVFAAGYLIDPGGERADTAAPTVTLRLSDEVLVPGQAVTLRAETSAQTRLVRYFADWRLIGESKARADDFALPFDPADLGLSPDSEVRITAVAQDWDGRLSQPRPSGETTLPVRAP